MRDWVMMICQVCNLQETEDKSGGDAEAVQCKILFSLKDFRCNLSLSDHNISPGADFEAREIPQPNSNDTTTLVNNFYDPSSSSNRFDQLTTVNEYENDSKRSTLTSQNNNPDVGLNYSNLPPLETMERKQMKSTGAVKKIPENLKLRSDDKLNNNSSIEENALYRASGPYIPLSDCFSGSPVLFVSIKTL